MVFNEGVTRQSIWICHAILPLTFGIANIIDVFI